MNQYVRGSMITFVVTFADKDGNPAVPTIATVYLVYATPDGVRQKTTVSMSLNGNVGSAAWDSSVARDGVVQYSIKGTGANAIVQDGSFTLTANESNPVS